MLNENIANTIKQYVTQLKAEGIPIKAAVLFGSYAKGSPNKWSDIDLVLISQLYDKPYTREAIKKLWRTASRVDSRIEPIPCGEQEWETNNERMMIAIARKEGIFVVN